MDVEMKYSVKQQADYTQVFSELQNFMTSFKSIGVHEGAITWSFIHFIKELCKFTFSYCMCCTKDKHALEEQKKKNYFQVVNYLLETYATDDAIFKVENDAMNHKKPGYMTTVHYLKNGWAQELKR